jgi:hypothetical protein
MKVMAQPLPGAINPQTGLHPLMDAAEACETSGGPDRGLDARIALAVFPALHDLPQLGIAVWQHPDGSRIRALRYSFTPTAAATLVPAGHWLEQDPIAAHRMWVYGPCSGAAASARHPVPALAISAAALRILHRQRNIENG